MAELGSLHVSLSLDANNFNGTIAQVNRNIRAMGGELQAIKGKGKDYENSIEGLSKRQDVLQRSLNASSLKLQETRKRYDELVASGKASDAQIERAAIAVNRAQAEYNRLEKELADVSKALKTQSSLWTQAGQKMQDIGGKFKSVGSNITSVGKDLTMKVTAPIMALGTGAFKAAVDFESAFAGVRKTVDTTEEGFARLEKGIRDMAKELPASANEIAAVAESAGQLGIAEENILSFTRTIIDLGESTNLTAEQGATEFARFANIVNMSQSDFDRLGSSIVALGNTMATTESEIMSMSMRLAAQGSQVGMTEAQITALAATMSSLGIQAEMGGTAMTTILKKIQSAVASGGADLEVFANAANMTGEEFKKAFETDAVTALDELVKGLALSSEEGENLTEILAELGIKGVYESDVMLRLAGASDLLSSAVKTSSDAWEENTALANEAEQRYKTTASQMSMLKNQVVDVGISLGQELIPIAIEVMDKIGGLVERFSELDDGTKKTIIAIGGVVAAAGPLLLIGGSIMSGIGGLVTTFGALSTAVGSAGGAIALLSNPIGWVVGAIAGFTAGVGLLYTKWDEFKNASPLFQGAITALFTPIVGVTSAIKGIQEVMKPAIETNDAWKDSVSEATAEVVSSYLDLENKATTSLNQLAWSGQEVTQEMAGNLISIYDEMGKQIIDEMQQDHAEQLQMMADYFTQSSALTEQEEQEIIAAMQTKQVEKEQIISDGQTRIAEILNTAKEEKRGITLAEQQEINQIQQTMTENAIRYLSENEREQKVILENLKNEASKITAEQAAEVVKNSIKQKDEVVNEANLQYKNVVSEIIKQRDEMGTISEEQARKLIDEAKKQRDETIKNAQDMHLKIVEEAQKQAEEHVNKVDWETGEIKTKWEVLKSNISDIATKIHVAVSTKWDEIWTTTKEKAQEIKQIVEDKFNEKVLAVTNKMDEVRTSIETKWNKAQDFLKNIDLMQIGKDIIDGLIRGIGSKFEGVQAKIEELSNNIPTWAKKILKIQSPSRVMMAIGADIVGGLVRGIDDNKSSTNKVVGELGQVIINTASKYESELSKLRKEYANAEKKDREKINNEIIKLQEGFEKDKLNAVQEFVKRKKELEELSLVDEVKIWEESLKHFQEGTEEKVQVQINYKNALKAVNDEIISINEEYSNKILEVSENLKQREKELTETYTKAVDDRAKSLMNFAGLFDEFDVKFDVSGKKLLKNLQDQVDGFKTWQEEIEKLSQRAIDEGLLEELRQMGPEALPQLVALNKLTDDELTKYSDLYKEKSELARQQATNELEWLKRETDAKLVALNVQTRIQLTQLQGEWTSRIKAITQTTEEEFGSMHDIGVNAMQGLSDGLSSMEPKLMSQARRIANKIRKEIERALDIRSPSRVMKGIGVYIGQGLIDGMEATVAQVANASAKLAESATSGFGGASTSTTSIDNSRHFQPTVTIHTMDSGARAMERTLRKMAFEFN